MIRLQNNIIPDILNRNPQSNTNNRNCYYTYDTNLKKGGNKQCQKHYH